MSGTLASADEIARPFREAVRTKVRELGARIHLRGILASDPRDASPRSKASEVYAQYAANGCRDVGFEFELAPVPRLEVEHAIARANDEPGVHGVIVYYPVFGGERDRTLQDEIAPEK